MCKWADRYERGRRSSIPVDRIAALHCSSSKKHTEICRQEKQEGVCNRPQKNLPCTFRRCRTKAIEGCHRKVGEGISKRNENLAYQVGCHFAYFQVLGSGQKSYIHYQCDRKSEQLLPPFKQATERLSERYGSSEGVVSFDQ